MPRDVANALPFAVEAGGVRLAVRLSPRADRHAVQGVVHDAEGRAALHLRIAAPPVEGAANRALIAWLAKSLGLRKSDIAIRSGETARLKLLHLEGDGGELVARLAEWCGIGTPHGP